MDAEQAELHTPPLNKIGLPDGMNFSQRMADWLMHARGNRRRAHEYRRWARESEVEGNLSSYRHYRRQAERSWRAAWNALSNAKLFREIIQ